jgi:hypothetical protein
MAAIITVAPAQAGAASFLPPPVAAHAAVPAYVGATA